MFKASLLSMLSLVALIGCGDETPSATESPAKTEPTAAEKIRHQKQKWILPNRLKSR